MGVVNFDYQNSGAYMKKKVTNTVPKMTLKNSFEFILQGEFYLFFLFNELF